MVSSMTSTQPKYLPSGIRGSRIFARSPQRKIPSCRDTSPRGSLYVEISKHSHASSLTFSISSNSPLISFDATALHREPHWDSRSVQDLQYRGTKDPTMGAQGHLKRRADLVVAYRLYSASSFQFSPLDLPIFSCFTEPLREYGEHMAG